MSEPAPPLPPPPWQGQPIAVQSLPYATPGLLAQRPGGLTAAAVVGVIIALLSVIVNVAVGTFWAYAYVQSSPPGQGQASIAAPLPALDPFQGDFISVNGLARPQRDAVIAALKNSPDFAETFNKDRQAMLDRLLADAGRDVFGLSQATPATTPVDSTRLAAAIRNASQEGGVLPTGSRNPFSPHTFTTTQGRVEITNQRAEFRPATGNGIISVDDNVFTDTAGQARWSVVAIDETLEEIRQQVPSQFNAMQAAALIPELQRSPVVQADAQWPTTHPKYFPGEYPQSFTDFQGNLTLKVNGKTWWIYPNGRMVDRAVYPGGVDPATGLPKPSTQGWRPYLPGSTSAMLAMVAECIASFLLALGLLFIAVRIFINRRNGVRMLRWWASMKLSAVICGAAAGIWFIASIPSGGPTPSVRAYDSSQGAFGVVLGLIGQGLFPTIILFAINSASVQNYAGHLGGTTWFFPPEFRRKFHAKSGALFAMPAGRWGVRIFAAAALLAAFVEGWTAWLAHGEDPESLTLPAGHMVIAVVVLIAGAVFMRGARRGAGIAMAVALLLCGLPGVASASDKQDAHEPFSANEDVDRAANHVLKMMTTQFYNGPIESSVADLMKLGPQSDGAIFKLMDAMPNSVASPAQAPAVFLGAVEKNLGSRKISDEARPIAIAHIPLLVRVAAKSNNGNHAAAMTLLEAIAPCKEISDGVEPILHAYWEPEVVRRAAKLFADDQENLDRFVKNADFATLPNRVFKEDQMVNMNVLEFMGDPGKNALEKLCKSDDASVRLRAIACLADMTADKPPQVLLDAVDKERPGSFADQQALARALMKMGKPGQRILLNHMFDDPKRGAPVLSSELSKLYPGYSVPQGANERNKPAVQSAARKIWEIIIERPETVQYEVPLLIDDPVPEVRHQAARLALRMDKAGPYVKQRSWFLVRNEEQSDVTIYDPAGGSGPWIVPASAKILTVSTTAQPMSTYKIASSAGLVLIAIAGACLLALGAAMTFMRDDAANESQA